MTIRIACHSSFVPDAHLPVAPMATTDALEDGRISLQLAAPVRIEPIEIKESPGARELVATVDCDRVMYLRGGQAGIPGRIGIVEL